MVKLLLGLTPLHLALNEYNTIVKLLLGKGTVAAAADEHIDLAK